MKYALCLANDGRILSATFVEYATDESVLVDELPDSPITDYRYVDEEYIYDPIDTTKVDNMNRIVELKQKLFDTDYNILKIVEGAATIDEMSDIIAERSKWRKEINELEKDLG